MQIREYEIIRQLGEPGGMGVVYLAKHQTLGERAIKKLHDYLAQNTNVIKRFENEAISLSMSEHPNIVRVYDFFKEGSDYYMVMEYVDGQSLAEKLQTTNLGEEISLRYTLDILTALEFAHAKNILHRDIKPSNILITKADQVKLVDFGIAKYKDKSLSRSGTTIGSPWYMSPEQISGLELDGRSDIYSLGITLFEMLAGRVPFDDTTEYNIFEKHKTAPMPSLKTSDPRFSADLDIVIQKATAKTKEERYKSAKDFADAVKMYMTLHSGEYVPPRPRTADDQPWSGSPVEVEEDTDKTRIYTGESPPTIPIQPKPVQKEEPPPSKETVPHTEPISPEEIVDSKEEKVELAEDDKKKPVLLWTMIIAVSAIIVFTVLMWIWWRSQNPPTFPIFKGTTTSSSVGFDWDKIENAAYFDIERSTMGIGQTRMTILENYFVDTSLSANTEYTYKINALDKDGDLLAVGEIILNTESAPSTETVNDFTGLPVAPKITQARKISETSARLTWNHQKNKTDKLFIERKVKDETTFIPLTELDASARSYIDNTIQPTKKYTYRLFSEYKGLRSDPGVPMDMREPSIGPPINVTVRRISDKEVGITWRTQNYKADKIVIERRERDQLNFSVLADVDSDRRSFTDKTTKSSKGYIYRLRTKYGNEFSLAAEVILNASASPEVVTPLPPEDFSVVEQNQNAFLSWHYENANVDNVIIKRRKESENKFEIIAKLNRSDNSYLDKTIDPNESYIYGIETTFGEKSSTSIEHKFSMTIDVPMLYEEGKKLFESGQYEQAKLKFSRIKDTESIKDRKTYYLPALKYMGLIEQNQRRYNTAVNLYLQALEIESHKPDVYFYLANCYLNMNKYNEAISNFEKVFVYRSSLSGKTGWQTIFDTDYGTIQAYYNMWQAEQDIVLKNKYADECLAKANHFLSKYSTAQQNINFSSVQDLKVKYSNVEIYKKNLINY